MARRKLNRKEMADSSHWLPQEADFTNAKPIVVEYEKDEYGKDDPKKPKKTKRFGQGDPKTRENRSDRKVYVDTRERGYTAIVNVYRLIDIPSEKKPRGRNKKEEEKKTSTPTPPKTSNQRESTPTTEEYTFPTFANSFESGEGDGSGATTSKGKTTGKTTSTASVRNKYPTKIDIKKRIFEIGILLTPNESIERHDRKYFTNARSDKAIRDLLARYDSGEPVDIRYATESNGEIGVYVPTPEYYEDFQTVENTVERRRKAGSRKTTRRVGVTKKRVTKKPVKKTVTKKTVARKTAVKKSVTKKTVARKTIAKKPTTKKPVKKTVAKKTVARKTAKPVKKVTKKTKSIKSKKGGK